MHVYPQSFVVSPIWVIHHVACHLQSSRLAFPGSTCCMVSKPNGGAGGSNLISSLATIIYICIYIYMWKFYVQRTRIDSCFMNKFWILVETIMKRCRKTYGFSPSPHACELFERKWMQIRVDLWHDEKWGMSEQHTPGGSKTLAKSMAGKQGQHWSVTSLTSDRCSFQHMSHIVKKCGRPLW